MYFRNNADKLQTSACVASALCDTWCFDDAWFAAVLKVGFQMLSDSSRLNRCP
jgi:hypothetical protein